MIAAVSTPAQKAAFLSAIRGRPYFHALLRRDLALWADNPGAPTKLFVLPGGALTISGRSAQLCGVPEDGEELAAFLRFAGVERVTCSDPMPGWMQRQTLFLYALAPGERLSVGKPPEGLLWRDDPSVMELARRLFPEDAARAEAFYSETCTALAHGYARVAALYDASGRQVSTVGAYAMTDGEAYMAMGETAAELRGRGIGGWLIAEFANRLSTEGWQVTFLCEQKRRHFYDRLGFACTGRYEQYTISGMDND